MINTLLGTKVKMSQAYDENRRIPATVIQAGPCVVTKINTTERDGYTSVQIGYGERKLKNTTKPMQGHLKSVTKDNLTSRYLKEVRIKDIGEIKVGDVLDVSSLFSEGDIVSVTGVSKGKGFAGVMKRWNFAGGPASHGQSDRPRSPGSIGQGTTPGRVRKGKKMAGRMGGDRIQVRNLKVIGVSEDNNELIVNGPIAGANGGLVEIKLVKAAERKNPVPDSAKAETVQGKEEKE
jgi:large subunit ribosomal protein L3